MFSNTNNLNNLFFHSKTENSPLSLKETMLRIGQSVCKKVKKLLPVSANRNTQGQKNDKKLLLINLMRAYLILFSSNQNNENNHQNTLSLTMLESIRKWRMNPQVPSEDVNFLNAFVSLRESNTKIRRLSIKEIYSMVNVFLKQNENRLTERLQHDPAMIFYVSLLWRIANCAELSAGVYVLLEEHNENKNILIERVGTLLGDHCFVIIGRDPHSILHQPETWGENAVICDAWTSSEKNQCYNVKQQCMLPKEQRSPLFDHIYEHKDNLILLNSGCLGQGHSKIWYDFCENRQIKSNFKDRHSFMKRKYKKEVIPFTKSLQPPLFNKGKIKNHPKKSDQRNSQNRLRRSSHLTWR